MKKLILFCLVFLFSLSGVMAIVSYCGDDYCSDTFGEADPTNINYCPLDCGIRTSAEWCENAYGLIPEGDCLVTDYPTCPDCVCNGGTCDISRISNQDLTKWCNSNGYMSSCNMGDASPAENNYYWLIFLIIGYLIGHYWRKK